MMSKGNEKVVHIFPQPYYHEEAVIIGNKKGLLDLKKAIEDALESGFGDCILMPSDAENYRCRVIMNDEDWESPFWKRMKVPYAELIDTECDSFGPEVYGPYGLFESANIPEVEKKIEEYKVLSKEWNDELNRIFYSNKQLGDNE